MHKRVFLNAVTAAALVACAGSARANGSAGLQRTHAKFLCEVEGDHAACTAARQRQQQQDARGQKVSGDREGGEAVRRRGFSYSERRN